MKKLRLALAVAVVAFFSVLAPSPAQAYPLVSCSITNVGDVAPGDDFTVTVTVNPDNEPSDFEVTYEGQTHTEDGVTETTATFSTDDDEDEDTTVFATVTGGDPIGTVSCSANVGLEDDDDDDGNGGGDDGDGGGLLPNTGGERLVWLVIGALLVLVGGGVVVASRRRDA